MFASVGLDTAWACLVCIIDAVAVGATRTIWELDEVRARELRRSDWRSILGDVSGVRVWGGKEEVDWEVLEGRWCWED